jgi:hypothetical protein
MGSRPRPGTERCPGGASSSSQPDQFAPYDIALGGGFVYFTQEQSVYGVPMNGGAVEEMYNCWVRFGRWGHLAFALSAVDGQPVRPPEEQPVSTGHGCALRPCAQAGAVP